MGWVKNTWEFCLPLISEKNDEGVHKRASLGRVAFWIVFIIAIYIWIFTTGDIQASHLQMLYITATYNLMKKASFLGSISSKGGVEDMTLRVEEAEESPPRI